MAIKNEVFPYTVGDNHFEGTLSFDDSFSGPRPGVLIGHAWGGQGAFDNGRADALAALGYTALAIDVYGKGKRGSNAEENAALMQPLLDDRVELAVRLNGSLKALAAHETVSADNTAMIGYCFGGLCALDLARSGAPIKGAVSLHGLFSPPPTSVKIEASILALHGWDDPMAPPESVLEFSQEMTAAGADWQLHAYGHAMHSFTNPDANDRAFGTVYDPKADRRSWQAVCNFLAEVFDRA